MPIDSEDQELIVGFLAETTELLEKLDDDLIALEKASDDPELMNRIFRSIHTVKGASSFLGFDLLVQVTHKTEDVLNRLRKGELALTPGIMDVILEATDVVKLLVGDIKAGDIQERDVDSVINKLIPFLTKQVAVPTAVAEQQVAAGVPAELGQPPAVSRPLPKVPQKAAPPKPAERSEDLADNSTVRVDVKRLDDLMNQVGELVLERNRMIQLNQDLQSADADISLFGDEFGKLSKRMNFVTTELQMQVLKMRMLPVEKVFKKFPRIVRSMARDLGKEVELQILPV